MNVISVIQTNETGETPYFVVTMHLSHGELKRMLESLMTDLRWGEVSHGNSQS
jgi:hypothetical protein